MGLMDWSDQLDIGVDSMNQEHKQILAYMNRLYDLDQAKAGAGEIIKAVKDLGQYTVKHFADEEQYMASIGFPDLDKHKFIHKDLLTKFTDHQRKIEASGGQIDEMFFEFLKFWLTAHIMGIDAKYAGYKK